MMDKTNIDFSWNYFASSHGKEVVDSIGGTLKRLVWMEIMAGTHCSSAQHFVDICHQKTKTIIVNLVQKAQFDATYSILEKTFKKIAGVPDIRQQHHVKVLYKDIIEYALYATRKESCVFKF
ncbi:unnamed protein product [Rotaria sordida]|uniref:Uncharacterized protein n=1 Tax=Rotaria sordida TaxID=392033 RepID=A0A814EIH3_9BILA|nr:unnamed protein product [Rotaria sordida]